MKKYLLSLLSRSAVLLTWFKVGRRWMVKNKFKFSKYAANESKYPQETKYAGLT